MWCGHCWSLPSWSYRFVINQCHAIERHKSKRNMNLNCLNHFVIYGIIKTLVPLSDLYKKLPILKIFSFSYFQSYSPVHCEIQNQYRFSFFLIVSVKNISIFPYGIEGANCVHCVNTGSQNHLWVISVLHDYQFNLTLLTSFHIGCNLQ